MSTFSFYNRGVPLSIPGMVYESDAYITTILNPLTSPVYAQTNVALATFTASSSISFVYTNNTSLVTVSGTVVTDATPSGAEILAALYPILPIGVQVTFVGSTFLFGSTIPGVDGNFTLTIAGVSISNTTAAVAGATLKAGRLVVPVTNNTDLSVPQYDATPRYRYPLLTDTATTLSQALMVARSAHTNQNRTSVRDTQGTILPGCTGAALRHGLVIAYPISILASTATLLVETNTVGDLVGRITATASATTVPLPVGKIFIESATTVANTPALVRFI